MKLHCEYAGSGPALMMAHGVFGSYENLGAIARLLARSFSLYRLDLRNHGRSAHADEMDFNCMAADVIELMDDHNLESAALLGHSLGGKVMQTVAVQNPERISHLVVGDISCAGYPSRYNPMLAALVALKDETFTARKAADEALQAYVDDTMVRQFLLKNLRRDENTNEQYWRLNIEAIAKHFPELRGPVPGDETYAGPALFLRGENSNYIQEKDVTAIAQRFPNAEVKTLADTSHWLHAEKPNEFVELALALLQK